MKKQSIRAPLRTPTDPDVLAPNASRRRCVNGTELEPRRGRRVRLGTRLSQSVGDEEEAWGLVSDRPGSGVFWGLWTSIATRLRRRPVHTGMRGKDGKASMCEWVWVSAGE